MWNRMEHVSLLVLLLLLVPLRMAWNLISAYIVGPDEVHVTPEQLPVHQCSVKTAGEGKTNLGVLRYLCLSYILR
jgi:hypothetical protein